MLFIGFEKCLLRHDLSEGNSKQDRDLNPVWMYLEEESYLTSS